MLAFPASLALALLAAAPAAFAEAPATQAPADSAIAAEAPLRDANGLRAQLLLGDWSGSEKLVNLDFDRVRTRDALAQLASQAGWSLAFKDRPSGRVDMSFANTPADQALLAILREEGLVARREGNLIAIEEAEARLALGGAEEEAERGGDRGRVSVGNSVKIPAGETVREAVSVGGSVEVDGTVLKDAVSVGGKVKLGPKAVVHGSVVSVGGGLEIDPSATVHGDRVAVGFGFPWLKEAVQAPAEPERSWVAETALGVGGKALRTALFFVLGLLLMALFSERLKVINRELQRAPGPCAVIGLVGLMAVLPLFILLLVTVVGIPLALLVLPLAIGVGLWLGFTSLALLIGARFPSRNPRRSQVLALGFGALVLFLIDLLIDLVPVLGVLALGVMGCFAFGAVLRTRFGSGPRNDANFAPAP